MTDSQKDIWHQWLLERRFGGDLTRMKKEDWAAYIRTPWNPKVPSLEEVMREALTPIEIETFSNYLRPLVESGQGTHRLAVAYLGAVK